MDYSDKIQTHIDALRHYLLAQAETNDPFVSQKDRNERISRDILTVSSARRGMFVNEIPGMNPGFASFLSRFSPVFTLDWNSEFMDEVSMMSRFARPFQIMLNASDESDSRMLSIIPEDEDFLNKADKLARISTYGIREKALSEICSPVLCFTTKETVLLHLIPVRLMLKR